MAADRTPRTESERRKFGRSELPPPRQGMPKRVSGAAAPFMGGRHTWQ
jgi:hypothetical protein